MSEIIRWLSALGLGHIGRIFENHNIDLSILPSLTEQDLKELGISIGDRRRLQAGIKELSATAASAGKGQDPKDRGYAPAVPPDLPPLRTVERRQLTVMFCDLVGSSALSTRLDPEDFNHLVNAYRDACVGPIERYGGFISRFVGD